MKIILIIFITVVTVYAVKAQTLPWQKLYDNNGIEFYYRECECHDIQNGLHDVYFLVQIHNTSQYPATVRWNYHYFSDDICINCKEDNRDIKTYQAIIPPGESIEGTCDNIGEKGFHVFSRFLNYKTRIPVTKFEMDQITVNFN